MRYLVLLLFVFSFFFSNAQDCPPGSVNIGSQVEADSFIIEYPNCTQINGGLYFDTNWGAGVNITTGFANIKSINGGLYVTSCAVTGTFAQLDTIMGDIRASAPDFEGQGNVAATFPNLKYIGGELYVSDGNETSAHISGSFPALERIEGDLSACGSIGSSISCNDCVSLNYIGGDIRAPIEGLNSVDTIMGTIDFESCNLWEDEYYSLSGYDELKYIGGDLIFGGWNECIYDFSGFQQLNTINGDFLYYWQYDYSFQCSGALENITGLNQLRHVNGNFRIYETSIENLDFLSNLETVGGNLVIDNNSFDDISGLDHAAYVGGTLEIKGNWNLSECVVQAVCDHISSNGDTEISNNLEGCNSVEEIAEVCNSICVDDFIFTTQQEIDDFTINHPECRHIEGNLIINGTTPTEINNLDGLSEILSISDTLFVIDNQALTDISGLENIRHSDLNHAQISGNGMLSACSIESLCDFISNEGTTSIYDNNENCNSETEVRDNCAICPIGSINLYSQAEVDEFPVLYQNCSNFPYSIEIKGNDVNNLNGLTDIEHIEGCLTIEDCPALTNLSGLDNLESVGCLIIKNNGLTDISALSNLSTVQDILQLANNSVDLTGLENVEHIGGYFSMSNNPMVTDLTALSSLDSLGNIYLYNNDNLVSLNGLQNITRMRTIALRNNLSLASLNGLNNVVRANKLEVTHNPSLQSLEGLNSLTEVFGEVHVGRVFGDDAYYDAALQSLSGLESLTVIDGDLTILRTEDLTNLQGLNNLISIGGEFFMQRNYALNSLSALENLVSIGGDFYITATPALTTLDGLDNLQTIDGKLIIGAWDTGVTYLGNGLQNINALSSLTSINGSLTIGYNNLTTLNNSLENLDHNTISHLKIIGNYSLSLCNSSVICNYLNGGGDSDIFLNGSGCSSVQEIQTSCDPMLCPPGDITLATQQEIDAFSTTYPQCTQLPGRLTISANTPTDINNLDALSQLTSVGNSLVIDNTAISNLNGLENLTTTGYSLVISNNSNLTSLVGLENITSTASHLKIENNDALTGLYGLDNIIQIGESLLVFDNDNLQNLSGLNALISISTQLYLKNNTNMTSLSGLESLTSIGTDIRLQNNTNLASISALSNVNGIFGYITISGHDALTSLMGLENINPGGITQLTITNNPNLSMCSASSICGHIEDNGMTTFSNNATGCNSLSEVTNICTVSTDTPDDAPDIAISPNPSDGTFTIQGITNATYNIRNLTGQIIQTGELKNETSIDISSETQGVYFISIQMKNETITKRIIKM